MQGAVGERSDSGTCDHASSTTLTQ